MSDELRAKLATLPASPGVYFHKSASGEVIYVGKAAVLKNRVRHYFQNLKNRDLKTYSLIQEIFDTDWVEVESEIDALFLESEMIKRYKPRYNVLLRDDKSQSFVRIDMKNDWPYVSLTRTPADDGAEYIGPFYNSYPLRQALRYLRRIYPHYIRPPKDTDSQLEAQIGLNPNRQLGSKAYKAELRKLMSYIKGNRVALAKDIETEMKAAAARHDFETAATLRNRLRAMRELRQRVRFGDSEYLDISKDKALSDLKGLLGLDHDLRRIEGYDISHHAGRDVVASMVVFTNGVSDRAEYRKFKMKVQQNDDTASMFEALSRRFAARNLSAWPRPDLVLIDGGKPQLAAARKAIKHAGLSLPIISIAKRNEELILHQADFQSSHDTIVQLLKNPPRGVYAEKSGEYVIVDLHVGQGNLGSHAKNLRGQTTLSPYTDITKLFQRIRDEAHRFALGYHTTLERRLTKASALDQIPGVGVVTRRKLMRQFGSLAAIQRASQDELSNVVGARLAATIAQTIGYNRDKS